MSPALQGAAGRGTERQLARPGGPRRPLELAGFVQDDLACRVSNRCFRRVAAARPHPSGKPVEEEEVPWHPGQDSNLRHAA